MKLQHLFIVAILGAVMSGTAALAAQAPAPSGNDGEILNLASYWRWWSLDRKPTIAPEYPKGGETSNELTRAYSEADLSTVNLVPPPANWADADFDDLDWARMASKDLLDQTVSRFIRTGTIFLRGKFEVIDPAAVKKLSLKLKYAGGAIVYLNGKEAGRQDMPDGAIQFTLVAKAYPEDVFVDSTGKPITKADAAVVAKRTRSLEKDLPLDALRKGTNVLSIQLHRADFHPKSAATPFCPLSLQDISLRAEGAGINPNLARPKTFQIWNVDFNDRVTPVDYGDPCERLKPVKITAARNGFFSGQVAVGASQPIKGLKAEASALSGAGNIPAANVQIRAILPHHQVRGCPPWFDNLSAQIPAEVALGGKGGDGAVQPLHFTVFVPKDAAAGDYNGTIKISADGQEAVSVPIQVRVSNYVLPDPKDFRTFVGVYQSTTAMLMRYKLTEWSEEHWKVIEKSLELLGQLGNKAIHIPVVDRTQYGNDDGMVVWVKKPDGSYDYDFTVFDRYIKLYKKYCGVPDFTALYIWHAGGWSDRGTKQENTVTVLDPATGKREHMQVPEFATEQSKKFWTPFLLAMKDRLTKEGMDKGMCVGTLSDSTAPRPVFEMFNSIMPDLAWHRACHTVGGGKGPYYVVGNVGRVILHEHCYGMDLPDPEKPNCLPALSKLRGLPATAYYRLQNLDYNSLLVYRTMGSRALFMGKQGFGRICLDFWEVGKRVDDYDTVFNRWPFSSCGQREPTVYRLSWPGQAGAEPTVRFEALREGVQEAEAIITLSRAVENPDKAGTELAEKCRTLLIERLRADRVLPDLRWSFYHLKTNHAGWMDLNTRVFDTAAEVAKKLGN